MINQEPRNTPVGTQPPPLTDRCTKSGLLAHLRALESQLYSQEVVDQVKAMFKDQPDQQLAFAQSRLHLTAIIATINASLLREIREGLEAQTEELQQGMDQLSDSLGRLEAAAGWAKAVNGVINTLGKIVSLV